MDVKLFSLTNAQKRIWYTDLLYPNTTTCILSGTVPLRGNISVEILECSIQKVIQQNDAFRIKVINENGEPRQYIYPYVHEKIKYIDFSEYSINPSVDEWFTIHNEKNMDLHNSQLYEFIIFKINDEEYGYNFKMHHIISDGITMAMVCNQITQNYLDLENGTVSSGQEKNSYIDYIHSEWDYQNSERFQKDRNYWLNKFQSLPEVTEIKPNDPLLTSTKGKRKSFVINDNLYNDIKLFCTQNKINIFTFFLSTLYIYMNKITNEQDIVVGTNYSNRLTKKEKDTMGMFASTVAARMFVEPEEKILSFLQRVSVEQSRVMFHQKYPYNELIQDLKKIHKNQHLYRLFGIAMEYRLMSLVNLNEVQTKVKHNFCGDIENDFLIRIVEILDEGCIEIFVEYRTQLFEEKEIENFIEKFNTIVKYMIKYPDDNLSMLSLISEEEKKLILNDFNDTKAKFPSNKNIHQLFEEQAECVPDNIAVVFENKELTYRELNERANQLARTLKFRGIQENQLVGIMVERSLEMVIGILAILKAGGAYVPIDPNYPEERINHMIQDSGIKELLIQEHIKERVTFEGTYIILDTHESYHEDVSNLNVKVDSTQLAYVIYTSGTTGKPKGTLIEHKNVVRLLFNSKNLFDFNASDTWTMFHSFCFDFSVWEMYGALLYGGKLVIVPQLTAKSPEEFLQLLKSHGVTILNQTPTYFYQLLHEELQYNRKELNLRKIIFGGEALNPSMLKEWRLKYPSTQLINMYGITETTVHVTYKEITENEIGEGKSNIGKPIPTLQTYIMDEYQRLQPIGIQGELYVTGDGLARGYMNRPDLTAEKFVDNPFIQGEKMYKTGDLARWLPDGNIEYLGRIDDQVKIRGYRIELGEVETALLKVDSVQEAVVIALENEEGLKQLCAYFVGDKSLIVSQLREELSQELPTYMIPSYFVQLDKMPLTSNGKTNRKALPSPEGRMQTGMEYVAPQTKIEKILVSIWENVLGIENIGLLDDFFDLGGDSIKSIQVSSRLFQVGYKVGMKELFKFPTISQLSLYVQPISSNVEQGEITGKIMLTPIQHWFFEQKMVDTHHFNQAFMLVQEQGFDESVLYKVMEKLVEHHDVLRTVFCQNKHGYEAWNRGIVEGKLYSLEVIDLREEVNLAQKIEAKADQIQRSINLNEGPLMRLGLFRCAEGDQLLIVIHHLVIDTVSWRILFEDIKTSYDQVVNGQEIKFPQKTDSFKLWAEKLAIYANSQEMGKEREYWKRIEQQETEVLPKDSDAKHMLIKDSENIIIQWTEQETEQLLKQTHRAYNTEINDLLLTVLGKAVHSWTGMEKIIVNLEGHGREQIIPEIDITRTVGWFTSQYPVVLHIETGKGLSTHIKTIKEELHQIPNKGIGYGILKYLSELQEDHTLGSQPEISFNYLGQFDQDLQNSAMQVSSYSTGTTVSGRQLRTYVLDINGIITDGKLLFSINYSNKQYRKETMEQFAELIRISLQEVIEHCINKDRTELTPSDISLKGLTIEELENLMSQIQ
ncbi:hypothetical protein BHU24_24510 [Bacillus pseudomycoides]|nr:hypothetical protein [Bacillus pseudomycoides]